MLQRATCPLLRWAGRPAQRGQLQRVCSTTCVPCAVARTASSRGGIPAALSHNPSTADMGSDEHTPATGLPADMPAGVETEATALAAFLDLPNVTKAYFTATKATTAQLTVQYSQRNLPANKVRKYTQSATIPEDYSGGDLPQSPPTELADSALQSWSPSGQKGFIAKPGTDAESLTIEVWGRSRLLKQLKVPKKLHGPVYNDGWFGSGASWSLDEHLLAYVAEAPSETQTPSWGSFEVKRDKGDKAESTPAAEPPTFKGQGQFQEDWGEQYTGKKLPAVYVLNLQDWSVRKVKGFPADSSMGQPAISRDGRHVVATVWSHAFDVMARRLGIVYCMNRPCSLYCAPVPSSEAQMVSLPAAYDAYTPIWFTGQSAFFRLKWAATESAKSNEGVAEKIHGSDTRSLQDETGTAEELVSGATSLHSARFTPDGQQLVCLSHQAAVDSGCHSASAALLKLPWPVSGAQPETVVPIVPRPAEGQFPGLYLGALPEQPFVGNGLLALTTQWGSSAQVVVVDLEQGTVNSTRPAATAADARGSWAYLTAGHGWVVASHSAPNQPASVRIARCPKDITGKWNWQRLQLGTDPLPDVVQQTLSGMRFSTMKVKPTTPPEDLPFEAILVQPKADDTKLGPLIVYPHGGPHSAYPDGFFPNVAFLCHLGFSVLLVNFRGSLGFGEDNVRSLPGNVGTNDVADCIKALDDAIALGGVDEKQIAVMGGSHGGLLTGHLVGQHPSRFRCASLRNPVMDVSAMIHLSDIPDWCYVEAWGIEEGKKRMRARPTDEDLAHFRSMSPIAHVDAVQAPMLFQLGSKDRRVPLTDAHLYIAALRARKGSPPTYTTVFPEDTHGLDKPQTEFECTITWVWWLKQHLHPQ